MFDLLLPALLVMASLFDTFVNFSAAKIVLNRLGSATTALPLFRNWLFPQHVLLLYGLSLLALYFTGDNTGAFYYKLLANFNVLLSLPLILQGLSVIWFYIYRKNYPGFLRGLSVAVLFLVNGAAVIVTLIGIFDYIFDFRKLRSPLIK
jgi:uncharacterized protein YybS (DUF2232 family)